MRELGLIGKGGFGNVYQVMDDAGDRYAKKVFSINQGGDFSPELAENVKRRFRREADMQAAISHPNIVPVIMKDLDSDPPSFIMPLACSSLFADMQQDKALGGYALQAVMDILSGLEELHSMHITHRDLKPQNVLRFANPDGSYRYAISDFGLISIKDTQLSVLTQTGMRMGSDYYTAPEIVADLRQASVRSDIYSVGCVMDDLFGSGSRIPCNEIDDSGFYADILGICTRRDPMRRFGSVGDLREAILSLGTAGSASAPVPQQVADYVALLSQDQAISRDTWEKIVNLIEKNIRSADSLALLKNLSQAKITEIVAEFPDLARRLCTGYASWVRGTAFDFGLCDGIANRAQIFLELNDFGCQADILLALLLMGTSHNRWYVERKFFYLCGPTMNSNLAKRLMIEIRVMKTEVCKAITHLEDSIGVSRKDLHPMVLSTLDQVC